MKSRKKETFLQSIFALMTSQVIIKVLGLFYKLYLTNRNGFGDEGNAIANGAYQVFAIVLSITAIGIPSALSKIIAKYTSIGDHKNANRIFKISLLIFSCIGMIGSYLLIINAKYLASSYLKIKEAENSIIVLAPSVFLVSVISVFRGYFVGREEVKKTAKAQSFDQFIKTFSTVILIELNVYITRKLDTKEMATLSNLSTTLGNIVELTVLYIEFLKMKKEINEEKIESVNVNRINIKNIVIELFKVSIPITLTALITAISKNIDSITIINGLKNIIGYENAKKEYGILSGKIDSLINLPLSFNMAIAITLLPKIASAKNDNEIKNRLKQSLRISMIISIPIFLVYFLYSNQLIKLLFPKAPAGGEILKISSFSILFITIEQIANVTLQGLGKTIKPVISITIGIIAKTILNLLLVSRYDFILGGTKGAAFSTIVCHFIVSFISLVQLNRYFKRKKEKKEGF